MSNQQQLELLKQGVDVWDAWRRKHPSVTPDLNEEDLSGLNLRGADLSGADLRRCDLSHADLSRARLVDANLMESILLHIVLDDTDLTGAYVKGASIVPEKSEDDQVS